MIVVETKTCATCGEQKAIAEFGIDRSRKSGRNNRCKPCDQVRARALYLRKHPKARSHEERRRSPGMSSRQRSRRRLNEPRLCRDCGVEVARPQWLCPECKVAVLVRHGRRGSGEGHYRRAQSAGVEYVHIERRKVCERDGWRCGICHRKIDPTLTYPHLRSASLDHIVPISRGGSHILLNVQAAHWGCNRAKAAKFDGQLMLM